MEWPSCSFLAPYMSFCLFPSPQMFFSVSMHIYAYIIIHIIYTHIMYIYIVCVMCVCVYMCAPQCAYGGRSAVLPLHFGATGCFLAVCYCACLHFWLQLPTCCRSAGNVDDCCRPGFLCDTDSGPQTWAARPLSHFPSPATHTFQSPVLDAVGRTDG